MAEEFILYLQLGDGDILVVAENGEVSRPLERDARLLADQTTSLCSPDAWRDFRVRFQALVDPPPALILLATDGYSNSFVSEAAFLQVGPDVLEMIRGGGLAAVCDGEIKARLALPIAGLMSDQPMENVCGDLRALMRAAHDMGSPLKNPFMTLSFLALPVIPSLKITDRGLVDVKRFDFVPLFVNE